MTCAVLFRVAPVSRRRIWPRIRGFILPAGHPADHRSARLRELLALLDFARAEVLSGWIQGWWSAPPGRGSLTTAAGSLRTGPAEVSGVCLVGALERAAVAQPGGAGDVGRAIDALYNTLWESTGHPVGPQPGGLDPLSAPPVRLARVQWLTRWNDAPGRTREQVVDLIDQAITRTARSLEITPAPQLR
jgi:hypothetical protein